MFNGPSNSPESTAATAETFIESETFLAVVFGNTQGRRGCCVIGGAENRIFPTNTFFSDTDDS